MTISDKLTSTWNEYFRPFRNSKVCWPADCPDEIVDDILQYVEETAQDSQLSMLSLAKAIKEYLDEKYGPYWHVTIGKNFGSLAVHESKRFVQFIHNEFFMPFKAFSSKDKVNRKKATNSNDNVLPVRRRLTMLHAHSDFAIDGASDTAKAPVNNDDAATASPTGSRISESFIRSKTGVVPGNPNKVNQDSAWFIGKFAGASNQALFGVADGHGVFGKEVSDLIKRRLPQNLSKFLADSDAETALKSAFLKTNVDILESKIDCLLSGSTCVTCLLIGNILYVANLGDSRAVLGSLRGKKWKSTSLSDDQKPDRNDERERIIKHNGRVEPFKDYGGEPIGPCRVWLLDEDVPGLAMSRSMGDTMAASVGVICEPEIMTIELKDEDQFIVVASDGVWEFMSNEESVSIIGSYVEQGHEEKGVEYLVRECTHRWRREEEVVDDTTAVLVRLKHF